MAKYIATDTGEETEVTIVEKGLWMPSKVIRSFLERSPTGDGRQVEATFDKEESDQLRSHVSTSRMVSPDEVGNAIYIAIQAQVAKRSDDQKKPHFHWEAYGNGSLTVRTFERGKF